MARDGTKTAGSEQTAKEILTGKEVQAMLRISRSTLLMLRNKKEFPFTKVGKKYRYLRSEIMTWLKEQRGTGQEKKIQESLF